MKNWIVSVSLLGLACAPVQAQGLSASIWRMHPGEGPVKLDAVQKHAGDPNAYSKIKIPATNDPGWVTAPQTNGKVSLQDQSDLATAQCRNFADFTYYETKVNIPKGTAIRTAKVSYEKADDGARVYVFNQANLSGKFDPAGDLVRGIPALQSNTSDISKFLVEGDNRIVIAQFDDCPTANNISGIKIEVNGTPVSAPLVTVTEWQMMPAPAVTNLPNGFSERPPDASTQLFNLAKIPEDKFPGRWTPAPVNAAGAINLDRASKFADCQVAADFTYFQRFIKIDDLSKVSGIRVEAGRVDDWSRLYINGVPASDPSRDSIPGRGVAPYDLPASKLKQGENRIVIVQADACRQFSRMIGARVELIPR